MRTYSSTLFDRHATCIHFLFNKHIQKVRGKIMYLNATFLIIVNLMILEGKNFEGVNRYVINDFYVLADIASDPKNEGIGLRQLFKLFCKRAKVQMSFNDLFAYFMPLLRHGEGEKIKE